eukprot:GILJ01012008.1.p1 GENE.GILJ01012008.1~~GILJ01012008.1.p1  ORF type:complete len:175 (-),score=22.29 GILJ01012008.1:151-675(-)
MVTASDEPSLSTDGLDLIIFPDNVRIQGVTMEKVEELIHRFFVQQQPQQDICDFLTCERVSMQYVLVCVHRKRDKRCGVAGPLLVEEFKKSLAKHNVNDVRVVGTSHIGGHKFAGTLITYPSGDWYGRLTGCDVDNIVTQHLINKRVVKSKWRGRFDMNKEQQLTCAGIAASNW